MTQQPPRVSLDSRLNCCSFQRKSSVTECLPRTCFPSTPGFPGKPSRPRSPCSEKRRNRCNSNLWCLCHHSARDVCVVLSKSKEQGEKFKAAQERKWCESPHLYYKKLLRASVQQQGDEPSVVRRKLSSSVTLLTVGTCLSGKLSTKYLGCEFRDGKRLSTGFPRKLPRSACWDEFMQTRQSAPGEHQPSTALTKLMNPQPSHSSFLLG